MPAQLVMTLVKKYAEGGYDRERARVRSWLCGIARLQIADLLRKRARRHEFAMADPADNIPDEHTLTQAWDQARRSWMLAQAMRQLREKSRFSQTTLDAFEMNAVRGIPAEQVAEALAITPHDVYMAKHRVAERLREVLLRLEQEHADDDDA